MGEIEVGGEKYEIERIGRSRYLSIFVLVISLKNRNEVDIRHHKLRRHLLQGKRSDLTDTLIQSELERFAQAHPDAEIHSFGVVEEQTAREADKISHD